MISLSLVLTWIGLGLATGYVGNRLRAEPSSYAEALSFSAVAAVLFGLIGWALNVFPGATAFALLGAVAAVFAAPHCWTASEERRQRKYSWRIAPH